MQDRRNHEKVIAVILDGINSSFSKDLVKSMMKSIPEKKNIKLAVISGKYTEDINDKPASGRYNAVYNSVYRLAEKCKFDGLIVHIGSMDKSIKDSLGNSFMNRKNPVPVVFIASDIQGETTVNYDNEKGISEAVDYLVNINGFTRICMLGGREDNKDALMRKEILIKCLRQNGVNFSEENYEITDMSTECEREARLLLDRNPYVQAVFCVNDAVARGLYVVMEERNLIPGKDIFVFGFDNTKAASEMSPSLTSIGADRYTLGDKAMELMLRKLNGEKVESALVSTKLYGRESFYYEVYDYTLKEMTNIQPSFICDMFRDCFYRYNKSPSDRESVDLERLFCEIISIMLKSIKKKYISLEEYDEIVKMIDKFFEKGAMKYTDAKKLLQSMNRLRVGMNSTSQSSAVNSMINSLFLTMKDKAISALAHNNTMEKKRLIFEREMLLGFLIDKTYDENESYDDILMDIDKLGMSNAAVYMFENPFEYDYENRPDLPDKIRLRCVLRDGDVYLVSEEIQLCMTRDIFIRDEMIMKGRGFIVFPIFYKNIIYGFLMCEAVNDVYERGEFISLQLGKTLYLGNI